MKRKIRIRKYYSYRFGLSWTSNYFLSPLAKNNITKQNNDFYSCGTDAVDAFIRFFGAETFRNLEAEVEETEWGAISIIPKIFSDRIVQACFSINYENKD